SCACVLPRAFVAPGEVASDALAIGRDFPIAAFVAPAEPASEDVGDERGRADAVVWREQARPGATLEHVGNAERALVPRRTRHLRRVARGTPDRHLLAGLDEGLLGGGAGREAARPEPLDDGVDHALGHLAVGGELAAGDRDEAVRLDDDLVATRDLRRL